MYKKIIFGLLIIIIILLGLYLFQKNSVPENIEQAQVSETNQNSKIENVDIDQIPEVKNFSFTFTGYGPAGKFHDGSFKNYEIVKNTITFKTDSVSTGIERLDKHLCASDFFDCPKYPEIKFTANKINKKTDEIYGVEGVLQFKDITKNISFDVKTQDNKKFDSEFILDVSEFKFNPALVESRVKIKFSFEI